MKWNTQQRRISQLIPTENNPRRLTEDQAEKLKQSLEKFDLAEIPAINADGRILAGHMRLKILQQLKGDIVVDVRVPDRLLTDQECREYLIRSNANTGEWDWDILANEFDIGELAEWGLDALSDTAELPVCDDELCPACGKKIKKKKQ